jgi:hypothetical protein
MYREDLDQFLSFFQKACKIFTISDSRNRYESLDEMKKEIGSRIKDLDVRGEDPGVHFLLNQQQTVPTAAPGSTPTTTTIVFNELRTEEISDSAEALFLRVREFLIERQRPLIRWPFALISLAGLVGLIYFAIGDSRAAIAPWRTLLSTLVFVGAGVAALKIPNQIFLDKKVDSPTFWSRHKDEFAKGAILALISSLIGGVIGYLIGRVR